MKRIIIAIIAVFLINSMSINAQGVDDVTLVVSGDGVTKEDATHVALRSAIEQAYGVFVSANTEIINDELVKDEIATVTSGNVKSYKELSAAVLPTGNHLVTLQAVVSTKKLVAYAQSKGASCEFAGAVFGVNLKMIELNKRNTEIAFENMIKQANALVPYIVEYKLEVGNPTVDGVLPVKVIAYSTPTTYAFSDLIISTLNSLHMSQSDYEQLNGMNAKAYSVNVYPHHLRSYIEIGWSKLYNQWYTLSFEQLGGFFYAVPNMTSLVSEINKQLKKVYISDNLGNKYTIGYIKNRYGHIEEVPIAPFLLNSSRIMGSDDNPYRSSCLFLSEDLICLPYDYLLSKKSKKRKNADSDNTFTPKFLGESEFNIYVPVDRLTKISNFEIKVAQ